jgi:hypothetical protein
MGVMVDADVLQRTAFEKAVAASEADLIFDGKQDELQYLAVFHFSDKFEKELEQLTEDVSGAEGELRQQIVSRNFSRYKDLQQRLLNEKESLGEGSGESVIPFLYFQPVVQNNEGDWPDFTFTAASRVSYTERVPGGGWYPVRRADLQQLLAEMSSEEEKDFWAAVRIDNQLSLATLDLLQENFRKELDKLSAQPPYGEEVLHSIRDFRVLAGLRYLIEFCRAMGVTSNLEPVLSFPLGSNVMSLYELARVYGALTSGMTYAAEDGQNPALALIDRIEAADGEIIYESAFTKKRVIDEKTVMAVSDILRNVVKFGTGRHANNMLLHSSDPAVEGQLADLQLAVPVFGKTGTSNRFTNSSFAGAVPGVKGKGDGVVLDEKSYVIASYVGFDDNRPMVRTSTHITGASGALPIWAKTARSIISAMNYAGSLDLVDMAFSGSGDIPLYYPDLGQISVPVAVEEGGIAAQSGAGAGGSAPVVTFGKVLSGGEVELGRHFLPYWHN